MPDPVNVESHAAGITHEIADSNAHPPAPRRRDTLSSKTGSDGAGSETCRICRSEGAPDEPLFYPCKCSGSIKFVHQECLMEWLSHSRKKHCELCKTPFRFTKLYDADMPPILPWSVFVKRAGVHLTLLFFRGCRIFVVSAVWLGILPWLVRWAWRWMFWFADGGWAREAFVHRQAQRISIQARQSVPDARATMLASFSSDFGQLLQSGTTDDETSNATFSTFVAESWPRADSSILSSWTYLSQLTPNPNLNRTLLDIFEGQLITCVVITGFILVFLIREWVVQQQPLVNLDELNVAQRQAERARQDEERMRQQADLLDEARVRLVTLQDEVLAAAGPSRGSEDDFSPQMLEDIETIGKKIDEATNHLDAGTEFGRRLFFSAALDIMTQLRSSAGVRPDPGLAEAAFDKILTLPESVTLEWEHVLVAELRRLASLPSNEQLHDSVADISSPKHDVDSVDSLRRPPMPDRDAVSRAAEIQRILEEADQDGATRRAFPSKIPLDNWSADTTNESDSGNGGASGTRPVGDSGIGVDDLDNRTRVIAQNSSILDYDDIPITNAGPDAKINIKRITKADSRALHETSEGLGKQHDESKGPAQGLANTNGPGGPTEEAISPSSPDQAIRPSDQIHGLHASIDQPGEDKSKTPNGDSPGNLATSAEHEMGPPERETGEDVYQEGSDDAAPEEAQSPDTLPLPRPEDGPLPGTLQRISDWFWGDIQAPQELAEAAFVPVEEQIGDDDVLQEAPFVPVQDGQPVFHVIQQDDAPEPERDPEVVAAAQQAGLDADAIEDAEDLEGIFELIGLQGPFVGLFQTSCFCSVLVTGTIFACVGAPYLYGKFVLAMIGAPFTFLIKIPLQVASFAADVIIDVTLLVGSWSTVVGIVVLEALLSALRAWMPRLDGGKYLDRGRLFAASCATATHARLQQQLTPEDDVQALGWHWAFFKLSVGAHASLRTLQAEVNAVLDYTGSIITTIVDTISSGSMSLAWERSVNATSSIWDPRGRVTSGIAWGQTYLEPWSELLSGFQQGVKTGAVTFKTNSTILDPSLVYWDSNDRGLAVLAGYVALAAMAAVYVALDRPLTKSPSGQRTEKMIRDTLRQAGGVLKVILIISIEMLLFPFYCGLLLDLAFLPLFGSASVATRWAFAMRAPHTFCFVHWFVGTCYMFHFALFVGMCRKILRKGVLWFIRDPDDPTFHPVRDVLERNVTTQLRKIAFSALVYGALVILCLGGVIWTIGHVFDGIFPVHWASTEPILEFPMDLLVYNFLTPLVIRLFRPSDAVHAMYAWWLRRCARVLRLSHFLFDDSHKDEEGKHVRKTWASFVLAETASTAESAFVGDAVEFHPDGKYVLTPCNDQYRPPKPGEAVLYYDEDQKHDMYIADKDGKKNEHFAKVYIPPNFRLRVTLFMVCLWIFSAFTGLCATLLPLVLGRRLFASILPNGVRINDIYAYSAGAYILGAALYAAVKGRAAAQYLRQKAPAVDLVAWAHTVAGYVMSVAKCIYLYGFVGLVLPLVFALLLQFYFILPLHTYVLSGVVSLDAASANSTADASNHTLAATAAFVQHHAGNFTDSNASSSFAEHSIHLLADYALGLLYVRIAMRFVVTAPASRAAEAFRRIVADGYLNPNARLATRFLVLPAVVGTALLLLGPLGLARLLISLVEWVRGVALDDGARTMLYRFSYPLSAGVVMCALGGLELGKATDRWRARIRDEVYLVGERLHNFGERKPPAGSKTVVRKDR